MHKTSSYFQQTCRYLYNGIFCATSKMLPVQPCIGDWKGILSAGRTRMPSTSKLIGVFQMLLFLHFILGAKHTLLEYLLSYFISLKLLNIYYSLELLYYV